MEVVNAREWGIAVLRTYFLDLLLRLSLGEHPHAFDKNFRAIRSPLGHVSGKGWKLNASERVRRKCTRFRQHPFNATYLSEFVQQFLEYNIGRVGDANENLP